MAKKSKQAKPPDHTKYWQGYRATRTGDAKWYGYFGK